MGVRPALSARCGLASVCLLVPLVAGPVPAALAETGPLDFQCTSTGSPPSVTLTMDADTAAPPASSSAMLIGEGVAATVSSAFPGPVAADAVDRGADRISGVVHYGIRDNGGARTLELAIPATDLGDQATPADVPFTATGSYTALQTGENWIAVRDVTVDLALQAPDGSASLVRLDCSRTSEGFVDVVRVVAVSRTTLSLTPSPTASYGQPVEATARVDTQGSGTNGSVFFDVDGVLHGHRILNEPAVSASLPGLGVGVHQVRAVFEPVSTRFQLPSETVPQTLTVVRATTRTLVNVIGRLAHRQTRALVRVRAAYDTLPAGRVRLAVHELGTTHHRVVRTGLDGGSVVARLGRLDAGRYRLVATYRGDGNHERSRTTVPFWVRR